MMPSERGAPLSHSPTNRTPQCHCTVYTDTPTAPLLSLPPRFVTSWQPRVRSARQSFGARPHRRQIGPVVLPMPSNALLSVGRPASPAAVCSWSRGRAATRPLLGYSPPPNRSSPLDVPPLSARTTDYERRRLAAQRRNGPAAVYLATSADPSLLLQAAWLDWRPRPTLETVHLIPALHARRGPFILLKALGACMYYAPCSQPYYSCNVNPPCYSPRNPPWPTEEPPRVRPPLPATRMHTHERAPPSGLWPPPPQRLARHTRVPVIAAAPQ